MTTTPVQTTPPRAATPRSAADRLARQLLRVDQAEPQALMPLKGSLAISAVRCVITYAIIPAAAPVITGLGVLATPLALLLSVVAAVMAIVSLRRVWLADWSRRWAYTTFIVVVLALLATTMWFDVRSLLA